MRPYRNIGFGWLILLSLFLTGCRQLSTEYGKSKGTGNTSLNGFGSLRSAYAEAGFRNRDISRFSDRVMRTDVIVWTPEGMAPIENDVTRWFDRWLRRGNKTLVYVVPDSGSEAEYWINASKLAPPAQRLEYRKRAARSVNERMQWRMNRVAQQSNGWFSIEPRQGRSKIQSLSGPWGDEIGSADPVAEAFIEFTITPYDKDGKQATTRGTNFTNTTGPGPQQWIPSGDTTPTSTPVTFQEVLVDGDSAPIVAEIQSERWRESRILVVAGGSLLTNYGLTKAMNQKLAAKIIASSTASTKPDPRAGFIYSSSNIPVTERKAGAPTASGMELLTVWPISLITMHGVILGLVICLMLLPIFGRPKRVMEKKHSEFGDHLDAVAALMSRTKSGEQYARGRISEYMKRMCGETSGPWVLPDPPKHQAAKALPILTSRRSEQLKGKPAIATEPTADSLLEESDTISLDGLPTTETETTPGQTLQDPNPDDKEIR
ncbi:MAG: hypothetical protein AB8B91_12695 [Rubripirellula sp.]